MDEATQDSRLGQALQVRARLASPRAAALDVADAEAAADQRVEVDPGHHEVAPRLEPVQLHAARCQLGERLRLDQGEVAASAAPPGEGPGSLGVAVALEALPATAVASSTARIPRSAAPAMAIVRTRPLAALSPGERRAPTPAGASTETSSGVPAPTPLGSKIGPGGTPNMMAQPRSNRARNLPAITNPPDRPTLTRISPASGGHSPSAARSAAGLRLHPDSSATHRSGSLSHPHRHEPRQQALKRTGRSPIGTGRSRRSDQLRSGIRSTNPAASECGDDQVIASPDDQRRTPDGGEAVEQS